MALTHDNVLIKPDLNRVGGYFGGIRQAATGDDPAGRGYRRPARGPRRAGARRRSRRRSRLALCRILHREHPQSDTRRVYLRACNRFLGWCGDRTLSLAAIRPHDVATYIEELQAAVQAPSVKQQLAAIRMLFNWLVTGQVVPTNPAAAVRGPKHVIKTGKTPVLEADAWRKLLKSRARTRNGSPREPANHQALRSDERTPHPGRGRADATINRQG
jgi:hypothetical protein